MQIIIKTLQKQQFTVDVEKTETILELKQKIRKTQNCEESSQQLIYAGQKLENDNTLIGDLTPPLKEGDFLVLVMKKSKTASTATTTPIPSSPTQRAEAKPELAPEDKPATPTSTPTPPPTTTEASTPSAPTTPNTTHATETYAAAASHLVTGAAYEQIVNNFIEMGFEREQIHRALRASFNNPDRAAEYLMSGIPDIAPPQPPPAQQPVQPSPPQAAIPGNLFSMAAAQAAQQQQPAGGPFDFLRNPQFNNIRQLVQQNPSLLQPVLQQLGASNPQILQRISQNQAEFVRVLNEPIQPVPGGGGGAAAVGEETAAAFAGLGGATPGAGPTMISVTAEEKEAIDRLQALGFDRSTVIQAYFACDKDETITANYLLEHGFEDDELDEQ